MLSREEFLKDTDLKRVEVEVDGGTVVMREMSVGERVSARRRHASLVEGLPSDEAEFTLSLALIAESICDSDGSPMFDAGTIPAAAEAIGRKSQATFEALQEAFARLNGVDDAEIEAAVGNSTEIPSASSSTGSPVISDTPELRVSAGS